MNQNFLSIIIPIADEVENISQLASEIDAALSGEIAFEVLWIDDGSTDGSWELISKLKSPNFGIRLARNYGQSAAIMAGLLECKGNLIVTMDGDLQNDPMDIKVLLTALNDDLDLIQGYRIKTKDKFFSRRLPSSIANSIASKILPYSLKDLGCSLRLFRNELIRPHRLMGEMHRIFGLYLILAGARYLEVPVKHRSRFKGSSKYGFERSYKFLADIFLFRVMRTIMNKPLYLYLKLALVILFVSFVLITSAFMFKFFGIKQNIDSAIIVGGMILFSTSIILIGMGFIAEILSRINISTNKNVQFIIREKSGF